MSKPSRPTGEHQPAGPQIDLLSRPSPATPPLAALVESILFVAPAPVPLAQLERLLPADREGVEAVLGALHQDLERRGIRLQRHGDAVQLASAPEHAPWVEAFLAQDASARLSPAALETLAVIAYRQPVTRAGVESVRGVNSDRAVATLLVRGLVEEVGRMETPGRPILLATTLEFLQQFGLSSLADLPPLEEPT